MKKITKATLKSFIKKNKGNIYIKKLSQYDSMQDMVTSEGKDFTEARKSTSYHRYLDENNAIVCEEIENDIDCPTMGICGVFIVGGDRFTAYNDSNYDGIEVHNCCGNFIVAIKKLGNL